VSAVGPTSGRRAGLGQTLVEFALVLPIFLALLFGVIDGGRLIYLNSVISQAAREGARLAAVEASWLGLSNLSVPPISSCGAVGGPVCPADVAALQTDVRAAVNRMVAPFGSISSSDIYLSCDSAGSAPTGPWTGVSCANHSTNKVVSVRLLLTFTPITPVIGPIQLSGSATMVIN